MSEPLRWPNYDWTGPSYTLQGTCGNCQRTSLVTVERGHGAPGYRNGPECPYCGCSRWVGWHAPEQAPEKDMLAGLRAAAQIPHVPIDGDDAPSAGGREAALEVALRRVVCWWEQSVDSDPEAPSRHATAAAQQNGGAGVYAAAKAALALTPTDAAKAVRELVEAARTALRDFGLVNEAIANQVMPGLHPFTLTPRDLRAALRPFGGAGDA